MSARETPIQTDSDAPPARFYGWAILGVVSVAMIATSPGQSVVVSMFNNAFREDLGITATALSTAYMVGTMAASLPLVLVGKASDRFGPRLVMGAITIAFALACAGMALVGGIVSLTVGFFMLRFLGMGSLGLVSGHMLALWFERRLGTMNGLKMISAQIGFATIPAIALVLIDQVGWRTAYSILGAGVVLILMPLVIFIARDRPELMGQNLDGDPVIDVPGHEHDDESEEFDPTGHRHIDPAFTLYQALKSPAFWIVALSMSMNGLIGTALIFHAQPLLETRGLDPENAASVLRTWSIVMMLTIFPAGWLADRIPARVLVPSSVVMLAVCSGAQLADGGLWVAHLSMGLFGIAQSLSMGVGPPTVARYFGRAHHGAIRAAVTFLTVLGTGLGPVILGAGYDAYGNFDIGLWAFIAICTPLALAGVTLRRPEVSKR